MKAKRLLEILRILKEDFEMLQNDVWEMHLASDDSVQASIDNVNEAIEIANKLKSLVDCSLEVKRELEWFNSFVDFVGNVDRNLYNQACEYADKTEE